MSTKTKLCKTNFNKTITNLYLICIFLFGMVSLAQDNSTVFFVSENTQVVGLNNIHIKPSATQQALALDSIANQNQTLCVSQKSEKSKSSTKRIALNLKITKKTATNAAPAPLVVQKSQGNRRNSCFLDTETPYCCSQNTPRDVAKKIIVLAYYNKFEIIFKNQTISKHYCSANSRVQKASCTLYFSRPLSCLMI